MSLSTALTAILKSFGVFSILLLLGSFLRAKIPLFQKLYLPACVIGGFIGLIVGPNILGIVPFSENTMSIASSLPNVFIIPVLSAIPMCLNLRTDKKSSGNPLLRSNDILVIAFLEAAFMMLQMAVGSGATFLCGLAGANTYDGMGLEMAMGFAGGHGTAASLGSTFEQLGSPWWEAAQGNAMMTATAGLIGGILLGIVLINHAAKKGYTTQITSAAETSREMRVGFYQKDDSFPSLGRQTTVANNIETLTFHIALLLVASLGAYGLVALAKLTGISLLTSLPIWLYGMIAMLILWVGITMLGLDYLFDEGVKNKLTGLLSDYLIVAAIMSIPVSLLADYWVVLLVVIALGLIITPLVNWFICKKLLRTNWFEKSLGLLGANCGVFVTGMLLIKMADPDLRSDALNDYSMGYTIGSLMVTPFFALAMSTAVTKGTLPAFGFTSIVACGFLLIMFVVQKITYGRKHV